MRVLVILALMLGGLVVASVGAPASAAGTTWSVVPTANPTSSGNFLYDVSCASATYCVAVGDSINTQSALLETWDGANWTIIFVAIPGKTSELSGASCGSPTFCVAVGSYTTAPTVGHSLLETWNGTSWSVVPTPATGSGLGTVSCVSARYCLALGDPSEVWNGTNWSVVASPVAPAGAGGVGRLSCVRATYCVAVGALDGPAAPQTLVEMWNGVKWSIVPSPNVSSFDSLDDVSCVSTTRCVAVGSSGQGGMNEPPDPVITPVIETWDGTRWSVTPGPATEGDSPLQGVSCVTATSCAAVGGTSPSPYPLIETGPSWTLSPNLNIGGGPRLEAVSCISVAKCVAVGWDRGSLQTLSVFGPAKAAPSPPVIVPGSGSVLEGNAGTASLKVPVTLSFASTQVVTAQWRTVFVPGAAGHQADPATDYTAASGTVTFAPGETAKTVTISVHGDRLVEPDEYVIVQFGNATNAGIGGLYGLGIGVITNDD